MSLFQSPCPQIFWQINTKKNIFHLQHEKWNPPRLHPNPNTNRCLKSLHSVIFFDSLFNKSLLQWGGLGWSSCFHLPFGKRIIYWLIADRQVTARKLFCIRALSDKPPNAVSWMSIALKTLRAALSVTHTGPQCCTSERDNFQLWGFARNNVLWKHKEMCYE